MRYIDIYNTTPTKVAQLDSAECRAIITRQLNALWQLSVEYQPSDVSDKSEFLVQDYKLRVVDPDDTTVFSEYIITAVNLQRDDRGIKRVSVQADNIAIAEMSKEVIAAHLDIKQDTPANIMTTIMGYSSWAKGTVNPTDPVDLTISYETVLSAILKLCEVTGTFYDVDHTNTEIDILTSLGSDNNVRIEPGHNLRFLRRVNHSVEIVNKLYGVAGGEPPVTIAGAPHQVSSIASQIITCVGAKVVPQDDIWNTSYQIRFLTGAHAQETKTITDCVAGASNDTITVSGSIASAVARDLFIIEDTSDNAVDFIPFGNADKEGIFNSGGWQDIDNLVKTPDLSGTYTAGLCQDWTKEGSPTVSEDSASAHIKYGTKSQKVQSTGGVEGIKQTITHNQPNEVWTVLANVHATSSACVLALSASVTSGYYVVSESGAAGGKWQTLVLKNILNAGNSITVYVLSAGGTVEFSVDSIQLIKGEVPQRFANPSEKKDLWDETYDRLLELITARVTYECRFADLYRFDSARYPFSQISMGDTVNVIDTELGIDVDVEVVEQRDNVFEPEKMESVISND